MVICPKCGNETSDEIFKKSGKCYWCGNTDFSEEAQKLKDYPYKLVNCSRCGKLKKIEDVSRTNPLFIPIPKGIKLDSEGWISLCPDCEPKVNFKKPFEEVLKKNRMKIHVRN